MKKRLRKALFGLALLTIPVSAHAQSTAAAARSAAQVDPDSYDLQGVPNPPTNMAEQQIVW